MPRPSLSRPPPISVPFQTNDSDIENEPPTSYNVRRHGSTTQGPTNRKLFFTPVQKSTSSPSPTFLLTKDSITRRHYKQHDQKTPVKTPLPRRPSNVQPHSTSRRPKITRLDATPSGNRTLQGSAPDRWRLRQITDLTAWLNHELSAHSDAATLPMHHVSASVVFLRQFARVNALYRSKSVHTVLSRLTNEICAGRLNVSKTIKLATFLKERDDLISLLLLNYHPHWLLLALSVVLGMNLATELDQAVEQAGARNRPFNHEQVLTQALENAIRNQFLADAPSDSVASREQTSPTGQERDRYNALILRRTLVVIYLLDVAKRQRDPIIKPDPPLFRTTSEMTSSVDILRQLQKLLLNDHGDIVRFLSQRGYSVSYKSPVFESFGNLTIVNLAEDMRDGTRLCKLASIMRRDHQILKQVMRISPGHRPTMALAIKKQNITTALSSMKECLPPNLQSRFQWHGTPHDIATGNLDKTIAVLWQIAALWMEYVVVDSQRLKDELDVVKDEFRVARRNPDSPSNNVQIDLTSLADSPSKLQIIESCDTRSGDLLLKWCATLCGIYGVEIRDFTEDFRDGAVLCLILHHYCPDLMRLDEINRIPAGEYRGAFAAEAEHKHVQKNLDLFMDRCRLLGTIPEIFLTAEATLAPAFRDSMKQESVGRVMHVLASYLFRRVMMEKETLNARREVWEIMETHKGTSEMEVTEEIEPVHERETALLEKTISLDSTQQELPEHTEEAQSAEDLLGSSDLSLPDHGEKATASRQSDPASFPNEKNDDLAHVYTRMRHVQSRRATRPRPSQLIADRERAASVILAHYRGYKARQEYSRLRSGVMEVQSAVRSYFARQEVDQLRTARTEELAKVPEAIPADEDSPVLQAKENDEAQKVPVDRSSVTLDENMRSLPVRIGQQILEFIPAFRRHILAMDSYSKKMLDHERKQAENQAATVIQNAARSHLARRTRTVVETERVQTQRTWMSCAAEAAKTALRIAENHRQEMVKRHEHLLTNAIHQAGNKFASEMSRVETARKQAALQQQKLAEMKVAQEAKFTAELQQQKVVFEEQLAVMERDIQTLESRTENVERLPNSSIDSKREEDIVNTLAKLVTENNAREDALRLIFADLKAETERSNRFESDLRDIRRRDQEAQEDILRYRTEWEHRFHNLDADIERWHGTLLVGAICMATGQYRLHMDELTTIRAREDQERLASQQNLRNGTAAFVEKERQDHLVLTDILAKLDADTEHLKDTSLTHELWLQETGRHQAQVSQQQCVIEADLDVLDERSKEMDLSWASATKDFDREAEEILCLIDECERAQLENDHQNDILDEEIEQFVADEQRKDMERRLMDILDVAEERFYEDMGERHEENENHLYCRHEIDIQLEQEDQEEALDAEEFEKNIEEVKMLVEQVEDSRSELDEHLGLLDSYIDQLFSVSPSVMVYQDIPDIVGEEMADCLDECSALYSHTCQLMEQLYVGGSDEEDDVERNGSLRDNTLESSLGSVRDLSISVSDESEARTASNIGENVGERDDLDGDISLNTTSGLYQRLVEEELEYYNGKTTHDIGVQTGSGPNSLSSSPVHDPHPESGTQTQNGEAESSEEGQSVTGYATDMSSPDNLGSSLPYSHQNDQDTFVYERAYMGDIDRHQVPTLCSPNASINASATEIYIHTPGRQSISQRTQTNQEGYRLGSPGPLDTLAQLALEDALDANYANEFRSTSGVQTSENLLLPSGPVYTPATDPAEKENVADGSDLSANKSSGLNVYGLRLDSPLRAWNSPVWSEDRGTQKAHDVEYREASTQPQPVPPELDDQVLGEEILASHEVLEQEPNTQQTFNGNMTANLGELSEELNAFNIQPHRQSVESVVQDPSSANKLESVMRRISIAASSPQVESKRRKMTPQERQEPHCDIIRTIFILIRYCSRSENSLKLRELGISIICDFCVIHRRIADIMAAEECIDVLTTCVQYHRDQDTIFDPTVRILWEIALRPEGKQMIVDSNDSVARLQNVYELLVSHVVREQKNRDRIRQANMIVDIVRKRRAEGGSLKSMTEALRTARDQKLSSEVPMKDSHRLLGDLVEIIS